MGLTDLTEISVDVSPLTEESLRGFITASGLGSITSTLDPSHTTSISGASMSAKRVEEADDSTIWNKTLAVKISFMDLLDDSEKNKKLKLESAKRALLNHVLKECPRCAKCPNVSFKEEKAIDSGSLNVYTACGHQGASSVNTHIICPDNRVSIRGGAVSYISLDEMNTYTMPAELKAPKNLDQPSTPDVDAW